VEALERICNTFSTMRRDHIIESWLDWRTLPKRFLYSPTRPHRWFRTIRLADFQFDREFRTWLREEITTKGLSRDDLQDCIFLLQNHALRVSGRHDFLALYGAVTVIAFAICKIIDADALAYIVLGLFAVFALSERTLLSDKKTAAEELLNVLRFELAIMGEKGVSDSAGKGDIGH